MSENKPTEETEKKPSGNKLMIVVIALLMIMLLAIGGMAFYMFTHIGKPAVPAAVEHTKEKEKKKEGSPVFERLDTFVVNLAGADGSLLQIDMQAELTNEEVKKKMEDFAPKIRSALILLLSSKTAEELATPEGKMRLQDQVKRLMNEAMRAGSEPIVEDVLFTSFIIQKQ